jgi:hypothetical protein
LRELEIDGDLNAGLRFDIHDATQGICTALPIGKHNQFACHDDSRKAHHCAFLKNNCGARLLMHRRWKFLARPSRPRVAGREYRYGNLNNYGTCSPRGVRVGVLSTRGTVLNWRKSGHVFSCYWHG